MPINEGPTDEQEMEGIMMDAQDLAALEEAAQQIIRRGREYGGMSLEELIAERRRLDLVVQARNTIEAFCRKDQGVEP